MSERIDVELPFARDGALRRVMRENVVQLAGFRAMLLQALSPAMTAGFLEHTDMFDSRAHTWRRLWRTRLVMNRIFFDDDPDEIQSMTAHIRRGHERVTGRLPAAAGRFEAGTPYRADDPDNLLWTLTTFAESAWVFHAAFVDNSHELREALWADFRIVGRLFGLTEDELPETWAGMHAFIRGKVGDGSLALIPEAREIALANLVEPPFPDGLAALSPFTGLATVALLPRWARAAYGLRWPAALQPGWAALALNFRVAYGALPAPVRYAPEWFGEFPRLPSFGDEPRPVRLPLRLDLGLAPHRRVMRFVVGGRPAAPAARAA